MELSFFSSIFSSASQPVVVCGVEDGYPLVFVNAKAQILLNPRLRMAKRDGADLEPQALEELLRLQGAGAFEDLVSTLISVGRVEKYRATVLDFNDDPIPVELSANLVCLPQGQHLVLYLSEEPRQGDNHNNVMRQAFHIAHHSENVDNAINKILRLVGSHVRISRSYIFESISAELTRNTYEWCNEGVEPAIQFLQNMKKSEYSYDNIMAAGVFVCHDIRDLTQQDYDILAPQGIKSLAIIPMYHLDQPLGYIGFDDCAEYRRWSAFEVELLESIGEVVASLIVRRKSEERVLLSLNILQTILDNLDNLVYVNDLETMELIFINKAMADAVGMPQSEILGRPCWEVVPGDRNGPCEQCPIEFLREGDRSWKRNLHMWEYQNARNGKWYLAKDSIIRWVDGRLVHFETATEFTHQKQYERQLELVASTDSLTGIYNREWGYRHMQELLDTPVRDRQPISLCFIDLDGLKLTNDTYGHDMGDDMIKRMVNTVKESTRKSDILFRWGGDEFILLLECDTAIAEKVIAKIQRRMEAINQAEERPYLLSFSFGITDLYANPAASLNEIVNDADQKMYANKLQKRQ